MEKIFNKTDLLYKYVDNKIDTLIKQGYKLSLIISELEESYNHFNKSIKGLDLSDPIQKSRHNYLFTRVKIMEKRIEDFYFLETLSNNYAEYSSYKMDKLFRLLKLRDKINPSKYVVEIPITV